MSESEAINHDVELDTRGLNCPLPILRAKKALGKMDETKILKVISTDVGSLRDFEVFCKQTGHLLMQSETIDEEYIFFIEKH